MSLVGASVPDVKLIPLGLVLAVCVGVAACGSDSEPGTNPESTAGLRPDIVYEGKVTDEALAALVSLPARDVAARRLVTDEPLADGVSAAAVPGEIRFRPAVTAWGDRSEAARDQRHAPLGHPRWWRELQQLVGPVRRAHAHGVPFTGTGYFIRIVDADGVAQLLAFTDALLHRPSAEAWATLAASAQPLSLDITWAVFEFNEVPLDGGPFVGAALQFRVE